MFRRSIIGLLLVVGGCRVEVGPPKTARTVVGAKPEGEVMIYSSMYRHVIDELGPLLEKRLPKVKVEWLQGGSEKLATRLDAELAAGATRADLVMTSDPLWYERLEHEDQLTAYASIRSLTIPRSLVDPGGFYVTSRLSTMVIAYNHKKVPDDDAPRTFAGLFEERWRGRVTIPDPLASGTSFTTLAFLVHHHGESILGRIKAAETIASGGNSSTLTRLESGEHDVGYVLLENILAAQKRGSPIKWRIPDEGAVLIPGPIARLAKGPNPVAAQAVYDVLLSDEAQAAIVRGRMHSPFDDLDPPDGAPRLEQLLSSKYRWTDAFVDKTVNEAQALRERFAKTMGGS